jgi:hypothetical protein
MPSEYWLNCWLIDIFSFSGWSSSQKANTTYTCGSTKSSTASWSHSFWIPTSDIFRFESKNHLSPYLVAHSSFFSGTAKSCLSAKDGSVTVCTDCIFL